MLGQMKALIGAGTLAAVVIGSFAVASSLNNRRDVSRERDFQGYNDRYDNAYDRSGNYRDNSYGSEMRGNEPGQWRGETGQYDSRYNRMTPESGLNGVEEFNQRDPYGSAPYGPNAYQGEGYDPYTGQVQGGQGESLEGSGWNGYNGGGEGREGGAYGEQEGLNGNYGNYGTGDGYNGYAPRYGRGEGEENESEEHEERERKGRRGY